MEPEAPKEREVTLEEAMSMALLFQKNGQLAEAENLYIKILSVAPDHPDALHFAGILAHQLGRSNEGIDLIERSLELYPDRADCYSNLGIIFKTLGRVDEAAAAYSRAIALDPHHPNAHSNLGVLLRAQGKVEESEAAYRKAIALDPGHIDAWHNLGVLLASQRRTQEAVVCYCKVTTLSPQHSSARRLLALAHCTLGQPEKAVAIFESWLAEEPDNPIPRHMLAACSGRDVPARAADAYVETIFDEFASSFEAKLAKLSYRAPAIVGAMLEDAGLPAAKQLDVLDAGCGTGLCGGFLAPYARRLVGVDLSGGMLEKAREKAVYDELEKAELTDYLRCHPVAFDVIVSADTLVYFGALDEVAAAMTGALKPGGVAIFTLEEWIDGGADATFAIGTHGRYHHARRYVERNLTASGLCPEIVQAELRMESGAPVAGLAIRAQKTS
jgi:predicted TPR repeat methyltransferase